MDAEAVSVTVEMTAHGEQIAGRIGAGTRWDRRFSGWLQLLSALQDIARGAARRGGGQADGEE